MRRDNVLQGLENGGSRALVDVRSPQEYSGELTAPPGYEQEGALRTGHIPSAQSIPWAQAVRDDGTFKPPDELRSFTAPRASTPEKEVLAYRRIGERSAHTWFVLRELLGYPDVKNYDGSWTEWETSSTSRLNADLRLRSGRRSRPLLQPRPLAALQLAARPPYCLPAFIPRATARNVS